MALKITTKDGTVIEGDNANEVIAALKIMQGQESAPVAPVVYRSTPEEVEQLEATAGRNPRGYNRKLTLEALDSAGTNGLTQSKAQQWIARNKREDLSISSVRHGLTQLLGLGLATREVDTWYITHSGQSALADWKKAPKEFDGLL